jgi:predicted nucleotidyltransferase component of viral defense system
VEVFVATSIKRLAAPQTVAGLRIGDLRDLMAMKIKVLAERGEARDYFDVKTIDEAGKISVEEGIELYLERYHVDPSAGALPHLYLAMGDLSDVEADAALPMTTVELQKWWSARQRRVLRNSSRFA